MFSNLKSPKSRGSKYLILDPNPKTMACQSKLLRILKEAGWVTFLRQSVPLLTTYQLKSLMSLTKAVLLHLFDCHSKIGAMFVL